MATTTSPTHRRSPSRRPGLTAKHHAALAVVEGIGLVLFHLRVLIHLAAVAAFTSAPLSASTIGLSVPEQRRRARDPVVLRT
jgi:hypothetical protein